MKVWGDPEGAVLAASGLGTEARLAGGPGVRALAGGGDSHALAVAIEREVETGTRGGTRGGTGALVSFGIAGALSPRLRPGDLIVAGSVVGPAPGARWVCNRRWSSALLASIPGACAADIAGSETICADAASKAELYARTGAVAVDMESHVVGRLAALHGLPFVVLRAIADPADRNVPAAARIAMQSNGGIDLAAVLMSLARSPGQFGALLAIARDARTALGALARGRRLAGDRLGANLDELALHVI